jgi:hypothetical protein
VDTELENKLCNWNSLWHLFLVFVQRWLKTVAWFFKVVQFSVLTMAISSSFVYASYFFVYFCTKRSLLVFAKFKLLLRAEKYLIPNFLSIIHFKIKLSHAESLLSPLTRGKILCSQLHVFSILLTWFKHYAKLAHISEKQRHEKGKVCGVWWKRYVEKEKVKERCVVCGEKGMW